MKGSRAWKKRGSNAEVEKSSEGVRQQEEGQAAVADYGSFTEIIFIEPITILFENTPPGYCETGITTILVLLITIPMSSSSVATTDNEDASLVGDHKYGSGQRWSP